MNLSQIKREKMMAFLKKLKKENSGNEENLIAINEIENELNSKKYGLVWEEHEENVDKMMEDNVPIFTEIKNKQIVYQNEGDYNFLIEGDNLHSLYLLEKTHKEKINIIYIDPPYNTGKQDFKYDDKYIDDDDGYRNSKWLSFMNKRLRIAKNLLSQDGVIFISIDDNEQAPLKLLCDEIFGGENLLSVHHIQVRYSNKSLNEKKAFQECLEYILIYAKNQSAFIPNRPKDEYSLDKFQFNIKEKKVSKALIINGRKVDIFCDGDWSIEKVEGNIDSLKETWVTGSIYSGTGHGLMYRKIVEPRLNDDGYKCLYKIYGLGEDGLGYRYFSGPQKSTATKGKMYTGVPIEKRKDIENGNAIKEGIISNFYDFSPDFGNIRHEGGVPFNSGKKPIKMLKHLLNYSLNKEAIILDFFAGSGSTGHAVMELNKEDGGNRHFILCTNNENNICEDVTYKRIKTVITGKKDDGSKYSDGIPANLKYYKTDFVKKDTKNLSRDLSKHVKELIQLENGVDIDNDKWVMILTEEDAEKFEKNINKYKNLKGVYRARSVVWTKSQKVLLNGKEDNIIPDYYFNNELKEVGENW